MKPIQAFQQINQFRMKLTHNDLYIRSFLSLCFLAPIAVIIWLGGPYIAWNGITPLLAPEKRVYFILFLSLIWLLKFLVIDLDALLALKHKDNATQKKLDELENRFIGALRFLKKATFSRQGKLLRLHSLPWYLLIGPESAGKTSLLAHADIHFILQKQYKEGQSIEKTESCDFWVTKDACIIDVPGQYLTNNALLNESNQKSGHYPILWHSFLHLIKKYRRKSIQGVILALPLPELIKAVETKSYQQMLRQLLKRLAELEKLQTKPICCQIIITKCDLLPGFSEFFAESSQDETSQAFGIRLSHLKKSQKIETLFIERFDALIKKLNQQLLFRLHQERNPLARPYIKDFPLQIERLKGFIAELLKQIYQSSLRLSMQGVYLMSALQIPPDTEPHTIDDINTHERAMQLFKPPKAPSRAFFIKQFMLQEFGFNHTKKEFLMNNEFKWVRHSAYAFALGSVFIAGILFVEDFQKGLNYTYALEDKLRAYQLSVQQFHIPDERLASALSLLNALQPVTDTSFKLDLFHILTFYSHKSKQNATLAYDQSLQNILLPEIKNYLSESLQNPVNKNADLLYSALKAYLMLSDPMHFDPLTISSVTRKLLPNTLNDLEKEQLINHLNIALSKLKKPLSLDTQLIDQTRQYFLSLPRARLAYIILKNSDNNNQSEINLRLNNNTIPIFITRKTLKPIPTMFTLKAFSAIMTTSLPKAAEQSMMGNWVLGPNRVHPNRESLANLTQELRTTYVNHYVQLWENIVSDIHLASPHNLGEADQIIIGLISSDSPLLHLLQTLRDNTYFKPVTSSSPKLHNLGFMLDNNNSPNKVFEMIASLQALHQYLQLVLTAEDQKKAAFDAISYRVKNLGTPDAITQLRSVAAKMPEPVKNWLEKIANHTWHFLMQEASRYLDTAWQNQVLEMYKSDIANRYPFNPNVKQEVDLQNFIQFFGNPGIIFNFYNQYLQAFIDTSHPDWRWKMIDKTRLPFSEETLRHLQQAIRIHHSFFPNGDNKLSIQFVLKPYNLGKNIKSIRFNLDDNQFTDDNNRSKLAHIIFWPGNHDNKELLTAVQLVMTNHEVYNRRYLGSWGWLKLLNQSFESVVAKKQMLINLSVNESKAQYLLTANGKFNPFLSLNLNHFNLPPQITE